MQEEIDIRYTLAEDEAYLRKWMAIPSVLDFFPMNTEKEVDDAIKAWMSFCRYKASLTATYNQIPIGMATLFLMPYRKVAHHAFFKVVVDPEHQKKGVGTSLIRNIKHLAKNYFHLERLYVEVFEDNPLLKILEKEGFTIYGVEEGYVKREEVYLSKILLQLDLAKQGSP